MQAKPATGVLPKEEITGEDGAPMRRVPAGWFTMGSNFGDADEKPRHRVYVDAFYMDAFEVTNSRYAEFIAVTGRERPGYWFQVHLESDGNNPVIDVAWHDADAYCRHYGKRLPTEAEWEKAARGTDGRIYPWGNRTPSARMANYGKSRLAFSRGSLKPVGSYEAGKSPYGIYDLAGNVWEWVADWSDWHYYQTSPPRNPKGPSSGQDKLVRGGSWVTDPLHLRSAVRLRYVPTNRDVTVGFRCLQDIPQ